MPGIPHRGETITKVGHTLGNPHTLGDTVAKAQDQVHWADAPRPVARGISEENTGSFGKSWESFGARMSGSTSFRCPGSRPLFCGSECVGSPRAISGKRLRGIFRRPASRSTSRAPGPHGELSRFGLGHGQDGKRKFPKVAPASFSFFPFWEVSGVAPDSGRALSGKRGKRGKIRRQAGKRCVRLFKISST